ncbi:MAG: FAD-binding protein [Gordonibacter sp.]
MSIGSVRRRIPHRESVRGREASEGPWYAVKCPVVYFGTVGGLCIDSTGAVQDASGKPIKGLFAAGENANGGLFNLSYVGGRSMPVCLIMGRIAGASAAAR